MIDFERFDDWVAQHDNDQEAIELAEVVIEALTLTQALLGQSAALATAEKVVTSGLERAYGSADGFEAQAHLALGDPVSALQELFVEVDYLNFEFAQKANALKCYAMTGMLEGESPGDTFDEKRWALSELIEWGDMLCSMVTVERAALPNFRSIVCSARARFSLDFDHPVEVSDFAHLAALFREGTSEQVKKTLQNQISAKQLSINDRRQIMPESAFAFLKGATGFPSIWMLPEGALNSDQGVTTPAFIPVCAATISGDDVPFLPSQRHSDGYHIGAGEGAIVEADYWRALDTLAVMAEPSFRPVGSATARRCKAEWQRIDRVLLENELNALAAVGNDGPAHSLTEQLHRRLMSHPSVNTHPTGHKKKGFRYLSTNGVELLLEQRVGEPWLYVLERVAPRVSGIECEAVVPTKEGRLSTLDALPTFKGQPLTKFKLRMTADLDGVLNALDL